jgi:large subunit ribosomal protein L9
MNVILTQDIEKLGEAGDIVKVKAGYGRNYLLPQGLALLATDGRVKEIEHSKRLIAERHKKDVAAHASVASLLKDVKLEFKVQVGEAGKLFGSVTNSDIHQRLAELNFDLDRRRIQLADPIKAAGDYEVTVRLHREVSAVIAVSVVAAEEESAV